MNPEQSISDLPSEILSLINGHLFHYTTLSGLASILKSKCIRFTRLDLMNDPIDGICDDFPSSRTLVLASCWTDSPNESVALWNLYTSFKGVRIELPARMFRVEKWRISGEHGAASLSSSLALDEGIHINRTGPKQVKLQLPSGAQTRVDCTAWPVNEIYGPSRIQYCIGSSSILDDVAGFVKLGLLKRPEWEFEKEVRFRIFARPADVPFRRSSNSIDGKILIQRNWGFNEQTEDDKHVDEYMISDPGFTSAPVETEYLDVPVGKDILSRMRVILGPDTNAGDEIIVRSLCNEYLAFIPQIRKTDLQFLRSR